MLTKDDMREAVASAVKEQIQNITHVMMEALVSTPERETAARFERGLTHALAAQALANTIIDRTGTP